MRRSTELLKRGVSFSTSTVGISKASIKAKSDRPQSSLSKLSKLSKSSSSEDAIDRILDTPTTLHEERISSPEHSPPFVQKSTWDEKDADIKPGRHFRPFANQNEVWDAERSTWTRRRQSQVSKEGTWDPWSGSTLWNPKSALELWERESETSSWDAAKKKEKEKRLEEDMGKSGWEGQRNRAPSAQLRSS